MKIGIVISQMETERAEYSTTRIGHAALRAGHEVWVIEVGGFICDPDNSLSAIARSPAGSRYQSPKTYFAALTGEDVVRERITVDDLDVLLLRNDPAADAGERPWAQTSGALFGQLAVQRGVIVLNDPFTLASAVNKSYFQHFPASVRPTTLVSRDGDEIRRFVADYPGNVILKPLQGSGGHGVFLVRHDDGSNINQIIEAISRDGYVVAQESLEEGEHGDTRLFVMNGRPLEREGRIAAFRRVNDSGDIRSNMSAGGKVRRARIDDRVLELVEKVRPRLVQDGLFLVGLDIIGDRLIEVNVFSPGGLGSAQAMEGVDFTPAIIEAIERKVRYRDEYIDEPPSNAHLASL